LPPRPVDARRIHGTNEINSLGLQPYAVDSGRDTSMFRRTSGVHSLAPKGR